MPPQPPDGYYQFVESRLAQQALNEKEIIRALEQLGVRHQEFADRIVAQMHQVEMGVAKVELTLTNNVAGVRLEGTKAIAAMKAQLALIVGGISLVVSGIVTAIINWVMERK